MKEITEAARKLQKSDAAYGRELVLRLAGHCTLNADALELLAALYAQFPEPKAAKPKDNFAWLLKAVPKQDARQVLTAVYVSDGIGYGCDGHRILSAPIAMPDGFYDKNRDPVDMDGLRYPDAERVLDRGNAPEIELDLGEVLPSEYKDIKNEQRVNAAIFQAQYIKDVLSMGAPRRAYQDEKGKLFLEFDDGRRAAVMPLNR